MTGARALAQLLTALVMLRAGRRHHSITLEANGKHLMTDVWTSGGVLAGLLLVGRAVVLLLHLPLPAAQGFQNAQRLFDAVLGAGGTQRLPQLQQKQLTKPRMTA